MYQKAVRQRRFGTRNGVVLIVAVIDGPWNICQKTRVFAVVSMR